MGPEGVHRNGARGCAKPIWEKSKYKNKKSSRAKIQKHTELRLSPVHSNAMEWKNKLDKTLKNYILDMPLTFETKKKKLKFYYLHGRDKIKIMLENCKT